MRLRSAVHEAIRAQAHQDLRIGFIRGGSMFYARVDVRLRMCERSCFASHHHHARIGRARDVMPTI